MANGRGRKCEMWGECHAFVGTSLRDGWNGRSHPESTKRRENPTSEVVYASVRSAVPAIARDPCESMAHHRTPIERLSCEEMNGNGQRTMNNGPSSREGLGRLAELATLTGHFCSTAEIHARDVVGLSRSMAYQQSIAFRGRRAGQQIPAVLSQSTAGSLHYLAIAQHQQGARRRGDPQIRPGDRARCRLMRSCKLHLAEAWPEHPQSTRSDHRGPASDRAGPAVRGRLHEPASPSTTSASTRRRSRWRQLCCSAINSCSDANTYNARISFQSRRFRDSSAAVLPVFAADPGRTPARSTTTATLFPGDEPARGSGRGLSAGPALELNASETYSNFCNALRTGTK